MMSDPAALGTTRHDQWENGWGAKTIEKIVRT